MKRITTLILLCLIVFCANAESIQIEGIYYNLIDKGKLAEVTSHPSKYSGDVTIPSSVSYGGYSYSVTSISENAFNGCQGLTSVSIPGSVTLLGEGAFAGCSGLTSVTIPNSVTLLGIGAFAYCSGLTSVTIPNSVTTIGYYAFRDCSELTSMTIPNSVTTIGGSAFQNCSGLTSMVIPNSVTYIYNSAFKDCDGLKTITIGSGIQYIGEKAFESCKNVTDVYCHATNVPQTDGSAFDDSYIEHSTLHVPTESINSYMNAAPWNGFKSVTDLSTENSGDNAPTAFVGINGIYYNLIGKGKVAEVSSHPSKYSGDVTIPSSVSYGGYRYSVTSIGKNAFNDCYGLKSISIPGSVTLIDEYAFYGCRGLTAITIPNSVTTIGNQAFSYCIGLTAITIPNSVTTIGTSAFMGCSGLTSIVVDAANTKYDSRDNCNAIIETSTNEIIVGCKNTVIPNSVTTIGNHAFSWCSDLTSITIPNSVTTIGSQAFYNCSNLTSITIPNSVTTIVNSAFGYCSNLTSIVVDVANTKYDSRDNCNAIIETSTNKIIVSCKTTVIPNSVTSIGDGAFSSCRGLTAITIPKSVTSIGDGAFMYCSDLISIAIPNSVTTIGYLVFAGCSGLTNISIPNSVTTIEEFAFADCSSLSSITIPNSVTSIGNLAFESCGSLSSITIPNSVTGIGKKAFDGTAWYNNQPDGLVYAGKVAYKYKGTMPSNTDIVLEEGTLGIASYAFDGCSGLTSITIPNSVTSIGSNAFDGTAWYNNQPDGLVYAGKVAYKYKGTMPSNTDIVLEEGALGIAASAFYNCSGLTSITIPNSIASIGISAFYGCRNLESITMHSGVTSIGVGAFSNCNNLTKVKVEWPSPISIQSTFSNSNNATLYVPQGSKAAYESAAYWKDFKEIVEYEDESTISYELSIFSDRNGSVTYSNNTISNETKKFIVEEGGSATLTFTPNSGYKVGSLKVNNIDVTSSINNNEYTINNINKDITIEVTFVDDTPVLDLSQYVHGYSTGGSIMQTNDLINSGSQLNWRFENKSDVSVTLKSMQLIDGKTGAEGNVMAVGVEVAGGSSVSYSTTIGVLGINVPVTCRFKYEYNGHEYSTDAVYKGNSGYTLTISSTGKGSVSYKGTTIREQTSSFDVSSLSSATVSFTPDNGYRIKTVKVNGTDVTSRLSNNQYTINMITQNTTVEVTYEEVPTYKLSITSSGSGSVNYSDNTIIGATRTYTINEGTSATLTFTPNSGYRIGSLKVNGVDLTSSIANNTYTISSITKNTTVEVTFEAIPPTTYTLSITSSENGSVTYSGNTFNNATRSYTVNEGTSATLTFTPSNGYRIGSLKVNGVDLTSSIANNTYTISSITKNTTVEVTFEAIPPTTYTLSITSSGSGSVSYSGNTISSTTRSYTVNEGTSAVLTFTPNSGYRIGSLIVNGVDLIASVSNNKYTISNISRNTTVSVTFEAIPPTTYTLSITSSGGGSVSYSGNTFSNATWSYTVNEGTSAALTFTPNSGYRIGSLKVNDVDVTSSIANNTYTISSITKNTTVEVTFEAIPPTTYTLTIKSSGSGSVSCLGYTISGTERNITLNEGTLATLNFTPNSGYQIGSVKVDGIAVTVSNNKYTISSITKNTTVEVTFEAIPPTTYILTIITNRDGHIDYFYTTNPSPGSDHREYNGTVTSNYSMEVVKGGAVTLTLYPNNGCELSKLEVNGTDVTSIVSNSQYTIDPITTNLEIIATFQEIPEPKQQIDGHDYVDLGLPSGKLWATMNYGASKPEEYGSYLNWSSTDIISSLWSSAWITPTLTDIRELESNCTWIWGQINGVNGYKINGKNGNSIFIPAAGVKVGNLSHVGEWIYYWTSTIDTDYDNMAHILLATASDVAWGSLNSTFTQIPIRPVSKEGKVVPPTTFTLSITSYGSGSVTYSGNTFNSTTRTYTVSEGTTATLTFTPNSGYRIGSLKINNVDVTSSITNNKYTISSITKNTTVEVIFEAIPPTTYTLSITSSGNGSVTYSGYTISNATRSYTVNEGTSAALTFTPNSGYRVGSLKVNNVDVTSSVSNNKYTISSISRNTTVSVTFEAIPPTTYTLSITSSGSGSVSYSGNTISNTTKSYTVNEGTSATLTFTPSSDYRIGSLKVNNVDVTSSVSNNKYTISSITKNTTVEVTFEQINMSLTFNGVNYRITSYDNGTVNVANGSYGQSLKVPVSFYVDGKNWLVRGMDSGVITSNPQLAAVIWGPSVKFDASTYNPNFLLYVTSADYAPSTIKNVIVNGTANSITLTEATSGNNFYCPETFTARSISYTHNYMMTTGIGESQGWETIALPFDVQNITHSTKGIIIPFAKWSSGASRRPFWLYELTSSGWREASAINAYTPYIISMPNNDRYYDEARLNGNVTFSATNVRVEPTSVKTANYQGKTFIPNFEKRTVSGSKFALNVRNSWVQYTGNYTEGSQFVRSLRAIYPFEAYMSSENSTRSSFPIFEDMTTGIRGIADLIDMKRIEGVYNLKGQKVKVEADGKLPAGIYIINGQKVIVK